MAKAFLFDLNGTIVDDMAYHKKVWYNVLVNELGAKMSFEEVHHKDKTKILKGLMTDT